MKELEYILNKYNLQHLRSGSMPIEIPDMDRQDLAHLFCELGYKTGVEVGVESGLYSDILLSENPDLTLYSIDAWRAYRGYRDHTSQQKLDRFYEEAKTLLAKHGERSRVIKASSAEKVKDFADRSLDFVYIDANHSFYNVSFDIHHWLPKVRIGGIISGHDYKKHKEGINIHVKQVVNAYTDSYFIKPWFVVGQNAYVEGFKRDNSRSWFWVRIK